MTVGGPAAVFARQHRRQLFPETPLLFASVDQRYLRDAPLGDNETAVAVVNDFPRLIDDILQVLPDDQAGLHGDRVRIARPVLAPRAREASSHDFAIA